MADKSQCLRKRTHLKVQIQGVIVTVDKGRVVEMIENLSLSSGHDVHVYDIDTKTVKTKTWPHLPVCTAALRWLEHYYCFNGHNFTRFHPVTGAVSGSYPKDTRRYFMSCANFGESGTDAWFTSHII